jgi:GTP-binding protein
VRGHKRNFQMKKDIPVVAIVGRPNVGKSTLFNRMAGRRKAIVHSLPGVTRDRLYTDVDWSGRCLRIIDTGGIGTESSDDMHKLIERQAGFAIKEAEGIIFVCDGKQGITGVDEKIFEKLRGTNKKIFIAVNKIDTVDKQPLTGDFYKFGLEVFPISASHGIGIGELLDNIVSVMDSSYPKTKIKPVSVAIVGTPNVGKSSFINALLNEERVIVHSTPGTTRDSVDIIFGYKKNQVILIDTAGLRKISRLKESADLFSIIRTKENITRADAIILIIDAQRGILAEELHIAALVCKENKPLVICINKWDLMEDVKPQQFESSIRKKTSFLDFAPIVFISAKQGWNITDAVDKILYAYKCLFLKIDEERLKSTIEFAVSRRLPPVVGGERIFIEGVKQIKTDKPGIRLVMSTTPPKAKIPPDYLQYLKKCFQKIIGRCGVRVEIIKK